MRVFPLIPSMFVALGACEKIPEPAPEVPLPAVEKKIQGRILALAGEVGERDSTTGHITIVTLQGEKVDNKVLIEILFDPKDKPSLKKLEILELRDTAVTKRGITRLKKLLPKLEVIQTKGAGGKKSKQKDK